MKMLRKYQILSGVFGIVCNHLEYLNILSNLKQKDVTLETTNMARVRLPHLSVIFFKFDEELNEPRKMTYQELDNCVNGICVTNRLGRCENNES